LPDGSFDLIVHQFGVMFFPDRAAHYREARRLLTPEGHLLFNTYDTLQTNDCPDIAEQTFLKLYRDNPLRFIGKVPHGYFETDKIMSELKSAGFKTVNIDTIEKRCLAKDAHTIAQGLCLGTPLRGEILARDPEGLARAVEAVTQAIIARLGDGPIDGRMRAHVVTAS
jgi:ubiquinone/menaquinone biosynthesis C-methylase UbiE